MFLKAISISKLFFISLFCVWLLGGCNANILKSSNDYTLHETYTSRYLVPNQLPAPSSIKSVQLYRSGSTNNPPIIELGSSQKLTLEFDELTSLSGQFRVTFSHHDQEWNESNIPTDWYMDGSGELIVGGGTPNLLSRPNYFHYHEEFPNSQINFLISGNYMLHVTDFATGTRLFSLPFFVTENVGEIESWVETVYNAGQRYEALDRPFSEFIYPDFVAFPEFDLSFYFVQNRFWGDAKRSQHYDFSEEDRTQFHLSRDNAFYANYDFLSLNLNSLSETNRQIIEWRPGEVPPLAILREDVLNFTSDPIASWGSSFGNPHKNREARYANVRFRFQDGGQFTADDGVYLVGDFNQWLLSEDSKLKYNKNSGYWETTSLIKEGSYTYKYAVKAGSDGIDDLLLSDTITRQQQEYTSFVYYQDPDYRYQRLLQVQTFQSAR